MLPERTVEERRAEQNAALDDELVFTMIFSMILTTDRRYDSAQKIWVRRKGRFRTLRDFSGFSYTAAAAFRIAVFCWQSRSAAEQPNSPFRQHYPYILSTSHVQEYSSVQSVEQRSVSSRTYIVSSESYRRSVVTRKREKETRKMPVKVCDGCNQSVRKLYGDLCKKCWKRENPGQDLPTGDAGTSLSPSGVVDDPAMIEAIFAGRAVTASQPRKRAEKKRREKKHRYPERRRPRRSELEIIEDDIRKRERSERLKKLNYGDKGSRWGNEGRSLKERRLENRQKALPKLRVCPRCERPKPRSRQWVLTGPGAPCCVGCARIAREAAKMLEGIMSEVTS